MAVIILHRTASAEMVILGEEGEAPLETGGSTETETSAKESTGGSPRVPKPKKRRTSSERSAMTVTTETVIETGV